MTYLTKVVKDENGNESVACAYWGTEKCSKIHNGEGCMKCPMMKAILIQLHAYEEIDAEIDK